MARWGGVMVYGVNKDLGTKIQDDLIYEMVDVAELDQIEAGELEGVSELISQARQEGRELRKNLQAYLDYHMRLGLDPDLEFVMVERETINKWAWIAVTNTLLLEESKKAARLWYSGVRYYN